MKLTPYVCLTAALVMLFAVEGKAYTIYLRNGQTFDATEHREENDLFVIKIKNYEVGFPRDDIDWNRTNDSIEKYRAKVEKEEEQKRKRKSLEEKEQGTPIEALSSFAFDKRGMQMSFSDDEIASFIELGEKNAAKLDGILEPYSFARDYLPSVIYTKKLRLILYGVEKSRSKKQLVPAEVRSIIEDPTLFLLLTVTGGDPDVYSGAEVYMEQDGRKIAPFNFKVPAKADRTAKWPDSPAYYWKIVANFSYNDFDLKKEVKLVLRKDQIVREYRIDLPSYR